MSSKQRVNWEQVEIEYRASTLSDRDFCEAKGLVYNTFRRYKSKGKWQKDLAEKVKHRAHELIMRTPPNGDLEPEEQLSVEASAKAIAGVVIGQRENLTRCRHLFENIALKLEKELDDPVVRKIVKEVQLVKDLDSDYFSGAFAKLVAGLEKVVNMERKAYGLDEKDDSEGEFEATLEQIAAEVQQLKDGESD